MCSLVLVLVMICCCVVILWLSLVCCVVNELLGIVGDVCEGGLVVVCGVLGFVVGVVEVYVFNFSVVMSYYGCIDDCMIF